MEQFEVLRKVLDLFCNSSGEKVIVLIKTRIFFSSNDHWEVRDQIVQKCGFQRTTSLGKYLGVLLHHDRVSKQNYQFLLDKVTQSLSEWKTSRLSIASRVTLTKAVIQAMPNYVTQISLLPSSVCEEIDKHCRNFFGGHTTNSREVHWKNWDSICTPKKHGGFGLRKASTINHALLMKVGWNLCTKPNALWVRMVRSKYKCGERCSTTY